MNSPWQNNSHNSSTGFVYFDRSFNSSIQSSNSSKQHSQSLGNSDFLSFNCTPPNASPSHEGHGPGDFTPQNYSSPRKPYYRNGSGYVESPKMGRNGSWRTSWGLTYNNQDNFHHHSNRSGKKLKRNMSNTNDSNNISSYYDPTCMVDPWRELEEKLSLSQNAATQSVSSILPETEKSSSESSVESDVSSQSGDGGPDVD